MKTKTKTKKGHLKTSANLYEFGSETQLYVTVDGGLLAHDDIGQFVCVFSSGESTDGPPTADQIKRARIATHWMANGDALFVGLQKLLDTVKREVSEAQMSSELRGAIHCSECVLDVASFIRPAERD